jgi:hypothetical protein
MSISWMAFILQPSHIIKHSPQHSYCVKMASITGQVFHFVWTVWQATILQHNSILMITRKYGLRQGELGGLFKKGASERNCDDRWKARRPLTWLDEWSDNNTTHLDNWSHLVATWHTRQQPAYSCPVLTLNRVYANGQGDPGWAATNGRVLILTVNILQQLQFSIYFKEYLLPSQAVFPIVKYKLAILPGPYCWPLRKPFCKSKGTPALAAFPICRELGFTSHSGTLHQYSFRWRSHRDNKDF